MVGLQLHEVPDHTTLWRDAESLGVAELQGLFALLVQHLHHEGTVSGRFLVLDATHVFAWANTRRTIEDDMVVGAAWGQHEGWFYGYKVHVLVDAQAELPVAVILTSGNRHDRTQVIPLLQQAQQTLGSKELQEVIALLGDGAYFERPLFAQLRQRLGLTINAVINPRANRRLRTIKAQIRVLFKEHGERIASVQDALALLPQQPLEAFGIEMGDERQSMVVAAIRERLHRHLRVAVERVFSRAKRSFWLERPRTRVWSRVVKHVLIGFIAMLLVAATATRLGWQDNRLALARVV